MEKTKIKITSAVAIDGNIVRPGAIVDVEEGFGRNLVARGKAEWAGAGQAVPDDGADHAPEAPAKRARKSAEA